MSKVQKKNVAKEPSVPKEKNGKLYLIAFSVVLLIVAFIRIRLLSVPLERDEGEYAYMASLILDGVMPFKEAYTMKLPGVSIMYAILTPLFGSSISGVHVGLLVVNMLTSILLFTSISKLYNERVGFVAAASYALMSLSANVLGFAGHATQFICLFVAISLNIYSRYLQKQKLTFLVFFGFALGCAFLMKQQAVFFLLMGGVLLLLEKSENIQQKVRNLLFYALGVFIPYLLIALWISSSGAWDDFWFWTYEYASKYASGAGFDRGKELFSMSFAPIAKEYFVLWVLFFLGFVLLKGTALTRHQKIIAVAFVVFAFLSICPGFYFRKHYFVSFLPAVALLVGIVVDHLSIKAKQRGIALSALVLGLSFVIAVFSNSWYYVESEPEEISKTIYGTNPFNESIEIAEYINQNSDEDDKVAVFGSEPQIYYYSKRKAGVKYLYTYPLMELHEQNLKMQEELMEQIKSTNPEYLVFCKIDASWLARPGAPQGVFNKFFEYTKGNYDLVGGADVFLDRGTEFVWGDAAKVYQPKSGEFLLVFRKRES